MRPGSHRVLDPGRQPLAICLRPVYAPAMNRGSANTKGGRKRLWPVRALYGKLAPRAYSAITFGALFCNLAVKLFHAIRYDLLGDYPGWIFTDIAILLWIEMVLALVCYRWPRKRVIRAVTIIAAVVCTWSVMNAGWLIRTGTQILPMELLPLIRDPLNILWLVIINFVRMPEAAAVLLIPSAIALTFFFSVLARPVRPDYDPGRFRKKIIVSLVAIAAAIIGHATVSTVGSPHIVSSGLRFNCHARAILSFVLPRYRHLARDDFSNATRELPTAETLAVSLEPQWIDHNVVIVVLEGVQYGCTSLATDARDLAEQTDGGVGDPTPYLTTLATQGVSFGNARSTVTHTTKALFGLLTGRVPSASQDIGETVPVAQPYASLATILERGLGFRTAFFQSAKGTFESRPGLVHNLGFQTFFARENLRDPNCFVGYLGADEFALLDPVTQWIQADEPPFLLVVLCSVTHDPYEVPQWFGQMPADLAERYHQTITYTDRFIAALDVELTNLGLADRTIFCVAGDHGEAFGEHRMMGHERIVFEEVLRIPLCIRAPYLIQPGRRITAPVSSVDLTPTILSLLGFDTDAMDFDGSDVLGPLPEERKVYFSGWMQQGPAGFVRGDTKIVYDPEHAIVKMYRLDTDPLELFGLELPEQEAQRLSEEIIQWRRNTIFRLHQDDAGQQRLFDSWVCKWNWRVSTVRYRAKP